MATWTTNTSNKGVVNLHWFAVVVLVGMAAVAVGVVGSPPPLDGIDETKSASLPPGHPMVDLYHKFGHHMRCPHAKEWISKGPEQAAKDLGLIPPHASFGTKQSNFVEEGGEEGKGRHRSIKKLLRRMLQPDEGLHVAGSCVYENAFSGQETCLELRGPSWTMDSMATRCARETVLVTSLLV